MTNPNTAPVDYLERWPGYTQQSWSERFAELDRRYEHLQAASNDRLIEIATLLARVRKLEARCASAEVALSEVEAERDAAEDRAGAMEAENSQLREALHRIALGTYDGLEVEHYSADQCRRIARAALNGEGGE